MARGFRGMKDDFMEIINHIIGLTCCSVAHDDSYEGQLLPIPRPSVGDYACLEVSQVFSASNTEVRDVAATGDDPRSAVACSGAADDGTALSLPQAEYAVIDEDLDPGFAAVRNTLRPTPTFESEENLWTGYNASLNIHASESLSSSQIEKEKNSSRKILERNPSSRSINLTTGSDALEEEEEEEQGTSKEISFESASDIEDYYLYSKQEGGVVSMQKHILVEDHMPSVLLLSEGLQLRKRMNKNLDDEERRDYLENDGFEYVIV